MLLHDDVKLTKVIRGLVTALSHARSAALAGGDPIQSEASPHLERAAGRLLARASMLGYWGESELELRLRGLADDLYKLTEIEQIDTGVLEKISDSLDRAIALNSAIASVAPLEQTPVAWQLRRGPWASVELENDGTRRSHGCAFALEFVRDPGVLADHALFGLVRREVSDACGIRLIHAPSSGNQRTKCQFLFQGKGSRERFLIRADGKKLTSARGETFVAEPHEHRGIAYFFMPKQDQPSALMRLLRLTWNLAALALYGLKFRIVAAPATLSWQEAGSGAATTGLSVVERGACFDLLDQLLQDNRLQNTLIVHAELYLADLNVRQWFTPSWRLPYDQTDRLPGAHEWLWTTAAFPGLPGSVSGPDLMASLQLATYFESGSERDQTRQGDRKSIPPGHAPPIRRAPSRVALRHPVLCQLLLGPESEPLPAYLVEYSVVGCRVKIPAADKRTAQELERKLRDRDVELSVPPGLYWPWSVGQTSRPWGKPRAVDMSYQQGAHAEPLHSSLQVSLMYARGSKKAWPAKTTTTAS